MFKAPIIEERRYYTLKRKLLLSGIVSSILIGILSSGLFLKSYLILIPLVLSFLALIWHGRQLSELSIPLLGKRHLNLDLNRIQIIGRKKETEIEFIPSILKHIIIETKMSLYQEHVSDILKEFKGDTNGNKITIQTPDSEHQYYFEIDSYYMIVQLKKILEHWKTQNINCTIIDPDKSV